VIADIQTVASVVAIHDDHFDPQNAGAMELLLEVSPTRFRFCVFEAAQPRCLGLEDYAITNPLEETQAALTRIYEEHRFLGLQTWKNVRVSFNMPHFTLIPNDYFRKEYTESYLQLVRGHGVSATEQVLSHELPMVQARNVFTVNSTVREWFLNTYTLPTIGFMHQTSALIDGTLRQPTPQQSKATVSLYFEEDFITIVVAQAAKLLICNKFAYKDAADMVYFVLFTLETLHLKPNDIAVCLYGEITPYSDDYQSLQRFLPHLTFGKNPVNLQLPAVFEDFPEHRYFSLYSTYLINH